MGSGLEGISCLWKSFYKSGQNLSVNLSDYMNDVESILFTAVQTELIENQHREYHGHVPSYGR